MEKQTRIFGGKDDTTFWSDKPMQKGHPKFKKKTKWCHIHWYNIPFNPVHKSPDGSIVEVMPITGYKCRCGKIRGQKNI